MQKIIDRFKSLSPILIPVLLGVYLLIQIIEESATVWPGFGPTLGAIISIILYIVFSGGLILSYVMKKEKPLTFFSTLLFGIFLYNSAFEVANSVAAWAPGNNAMAIICSIVDLILYGLVTLILIFHILSLFLPKYEGLKKYNAFIALVILGVSIIAFILGFIRCITGGFGWIAYLRRIAEYLAYVPAMILIYLNFFNTDTTIVIPSMNRQTKKESQE